MINRRDTLKLCGRTTALMMLQQAVGFGFPGSVLYADVSPLTLIDSAGLPLKAGDLQSGVESIFFYPHMATPCFLIDIGSEVAGKTVSLASGDSYEWEGGVGKNRSVVAFSAICAHKQSYPSKVKSMIHYNQQNQSIRCCTHDGEFLLREGGAPTEASPTQNSLAAVLLNWDPETDHLNVKGMIGPVFFKKFFKRYKSRLRRGYGSSAKARSQVTRIEVVPLREYCKKVTACS